MMTDFENLDGCLISVWIVGNITAPPKQNNIVPKETKNDLKLSFFLDLNLYKNSCKSNYLNVISLCDGNGEVISLILWIKISKHATAVNNIAPTAMGQKSLGVPSMDTGTIRAVITRVQSQK